MTERSRRRTTSRRRQGRRWLDSPETDREAERREEEKRGDWDPPAQYDDPGPDGYGWAPDPYPDGGLV